MKDCIRLSVVLLASLLFGACSSSDSDSIENVNTAYTETTVSEAPVWQVDWNNNQDRPDWTEPNASAYENWTILMVQIEEALQPYVSENDLMAVFLNGELRGLASPAIVVGDDQAGSTKFLMKAYGNETESETVNIRLSYYCQKLQHLFSLSADISMSSDESTGTDEDYIPPFTLGSSKYPVVKAVDVETFLSKVGITPGTGTMSAFVGDECRGTVALSAAGSTKLVVLGRSTGESVTLKYYDPAKGKVYTIPNAVTL